MFTCSYSGVVDHSELQTTRVHCLCLIVICNKYSKVIFLWFIVLRTQHAQGVVPCVGSDHEIWESRIHAFSIWWDQRWKNYWTPVEWNSCGFSISCSRDQGSGSVSGWSQSICKLWRFQVTCSWLNFIQIRVRQWTFCVPIFFCFQKQMFWRLKCLYESYTGFLDEAWF